MFCRMSAEETWLSCPLSRGMTRMSSPLAVPVLQADSRIRDSLFHTPDDCFLGVEKLSFLASPGISWESEG